MDLKKYRENLYEQLRQIQYLEDLYEKSSLKHFLIEEMSSRITNPETKDFETLTGILLGEIEINEERAKHLEEIFDIPSEFFLNV